MIRSLTKTICTLSHIENDQIIEVSTGKRLPVTIFLGKPGHRRSSVDKKVDLETLHFTRLISIALIPVRNHPLPR